MRESRNVPLATLRQSSGLRFGQLPGSSTLQGFYSEQAPRTLPCLHWLTASRHIFKPTTQSKAVEDDIVRSRMRTTEMVKKIQNNPCKVDLVRSSPPPCTPLAPSTEACKRRRPPPREGDLPHDEDESTSNPCHPYRRLEAGLVDRFSRRDRAAVQRSVKNDIGTSQRRGPWQLDTSACQIS